MIQLSVSDVGFDDATQMGVILLIDEKTEKVLPIWIGLIETQSILAKLRNLPSERPMTHDLIKNIIEKMGGKIENITINELRNKTFHAEILISIGKSSLAIDARPSDAIALAMRTGSRILVSNQLMENSVTKKDFEEKQKNDIFKNILEKVDVKDLPKA